MDIFAPFREYLDALAVGPLEVVVLGCMLTPILIAHLRSRAGAAQRGHATGPRGAAVAPASTERLLATVSHELRTPLNAIIGFSEMLAKDNLDAARRQEYARMINGSGQHLLSVVNVILDLAKIENGHFTITPETFAPGPVVRDCCDLLALKTQEAGVDLVVSIAPQLPEIIADKRALKQIVFNLLANAVRFTERGGRVTVALQAQARALVLAVEDTGIGIAEKDLARLGSPFFQTHNAHGRCRDGTGLGLSIVKRLVSLHGGRIEISSTVGEGTAVSIRLPLDCRAAAGERRPCRIETLPVRTSTPDNSFVR